MKPGWYLVVTPEHALMVWEFKPGLYPASLGPQVLVARIRSYPDNRTLSMYLTPEGIKGARGKSPGLELASDAYATFLRRRA